MSRIPSKIMHVDDDDDIREIVKVVLETIGGFEVIQCSSGLDAISTISILVPDLLLIDFMMPDLNGKEMLERIRGLSDCDDIPAIFMTAKADGDVRALQNEPGVIGVITKPFDPMTLSEQILNAWNSKVKER